MALHKTRVTRVLPYAPEDLFRMVGDVDAYPEFVPWISAMRTWNKAEPAEGISTVDAEARVGFAIVRETFATRVRRDAKALTIEVGLLYGPFKHLRNLWRFLPDPAGTKIEFDLDFEFRSRLLDALLSANSRYAADRIMACFEGRAKALYGAATAAG